MDLFLEPSEKNNHLIYLFMCAVFVTLDCEGEAEQKLTFYPLSFLTQFSLKSATLSPTTLSG